MELQNEHKIEENHRAIKKQKTVSTFFFSYSKRNNIVWWPYRRIKEFIKGIFSLYNMKY